MNTKTCKDCKQKLAVSIFYKDKSSKDGLNGRCKPCDISKRASRASRQRQNEKAAEGRKKILFKESDYRNHYQRKLGGSMEVRTPAGYIDLLTADYIIEIKEGSSWKEGVGQLLCYQNYYQAHKLKLILLDYTGVNKEVVGECCKRLGIYVEYSKQGYYNPDGYPYFV